MTQRDESEIQPLNNYGRYRAPGSERRRRGDSAPDGRYDGRTHNTRLPAAGLARTPTADTILARLDTQIARADAAAARQREAMGFGGRGDPEALRLEGQAEELRRRRDALARHDTTVGAIADPWGAPSPGRSGPVRTAAAINRRVDILEMERSHDRISEAAYQAGRQVQAVLERLGKVKSVDWGGASRGDPALTRLLNTIRLVCGSREILELQERIRGRIGIYDMRLLRQVIGDRLSFADCAAAQGKGGDRGQTYIAERFRDALEQLAEVFASKGRTRPVPDDVHKAAAADLDRREANAMAAGVTRVRLATELAEARGALAAATSFRQRVRLAAEADGIERRLAAFDT